MDYFLMIIIMSIISVLMIVFFGVLSDINVLMTIIMLLCHQREPGLNQPKPKRVCIRSVSQ